MSLTIPAGHGVAAWHFRFDQDPQDMICTMGVRALAGPLGQAHAERLCRAWIEHLLPNQLVTVTLLKAVLRVRQDGGGDTVYEAPSNPTAVGSTSGSGLPSNTSVIVEKLTARGGRRGKGRMFVPGINDTQVDNAGNVAAANINSWNTALAAFLTKLKAADQPPPSPQSPVQPVLFHGPTTETVRNRGGGVTTITITEGAPGPLPDDITSFVLDSKAGTQRRRMR